MSWLMIVRIGLTIASAAFGLWSARNGVEATYKFADGSEVTGFDWFATLGPMLASAASAVTAWFSGSLFPGLGNVSGKEVSDVVAALFAWAGDKDNPKRKRILRNELVDVFFQLVDEDDPEIAALLAQVSTKLHAKEVAAIVKQCVKAEGAAK